MSTRVSEHLRRNVYGLIAIFIALGGSAVAANQAAKNSVTSKSIKNGQVKNKDLAGNSVDGAKLADGAISGADVAKDSLTGANIDEATLEGLGGASGVAGGDLTGSYPNPTIAADAVAAGEVADGSLSGAEILDGALSTDDIDESTLGFTAGADITGTLGTSVIAANAVGSGEVADETLVSADVDDRSLTLNDLSTADSALGSTSIGVNLAAGACTSVATGLSGLAVGDLVIVVPRSVTAGIFTPPVRVTTTGQFPLTLCNHSPAAINNPAANVDVFAMRP